MPIQIPTTQEIIDQNIANLESSLNQDTPAADIAFNNVVAVMVGLAFTSLYKYAAERVLQNLVITATGEDLDRLGREYRVIRKPAEAAVVTVSLPADDDTIIPVTAIYTADANGLQYFPLTQAVATGGFAVHDIRCEETGVSGNLNISDTLEIDTQIPGAERIATVTAIVNTGAEKETDTAYRRRILDEIRTKGGGGNTADYRRWAEEVAGVERAYPYAGNPTDLAEDDGSSVPPERTIYIEATSDIDPDGIAPQSLLDEVEAAIITDPETGIARQPLGLTNDTLYVVSISRTSIFVRIINLDVDSGIEAQVKNDIETALAVYFQSLRPFIPGLDSEIDRNDTITDPSISCVVQEVVEAYGGSIEGVGFGLLPGSFISAYTLLPGELTKSGGVSYVTT